MLEILTAALFTASTAFGAANPAPAAFEVPNSGLTFWAQKSFQGQYINYQTVPTGCTNLPFDAWSGVNMINADGVLAYPGPDCTGIPFGFSFHSFNRVARSFKAR